MMLDNAALCKEKITQEHIQSKHAHSERMGPYKTPFISTEEKRNVELKPGLPTFHSFCTWACLCLTCMQVSDAVAITTYYLT